MKRSLFLATAVLFVGSLFVGVHKAQAVYWDPVYHIVVVTQGSNCTLTPDPAQKSLDTVYTLNISLTKQINKAYHNYWSRWPRCDELQYHAEHNNSYGKVVAWLRAVMRRRIANHELQGTYVDGSRKVWQLINDHRWQLNDWPTMMAWGFLSKDVQKISSVYDPALYAAYQEHPARVYSEGPYYQYVQQAWHDTSGAVPEPGTPEFFYGPTPQSIIDEVTLYGTNQRYGFFLYRNACSLGTLAGTVGCRYLDKSFMTVNPCVVLDSAHPSCVL